MEIDCQKDGRAVSVKISGSIDSTSITQLESKLQEEVVGECDLTLDFSGVDYISSVGLRLVAMYGRRMMSGGGKLAVTNVCPSVKEVFDMTGFSMILDIQ